MGSILEPWKFSCIADESEAIEASGGSDAPGEALTALNAFVAFHASSGPYLAPLARLLRRNRIVGFDGRDRNRETVMPRACRRHVTISPKGA
jgi:hypothetical protein